MSSFVDIDHDGSVVKAPRVPGLRAISQVYAAAWERLDVSGASLLDTGDAEQTRDNAGRGIVRITSCANEH